MPGLGEQTGTGLTVTHNPSRASTLCLLEFGAHAAKCTRGAATLNSGSRCAGSQVFGLWQEFQVFRVKWFAVNLQRMLEILLKFNHNKQQLASDGTACGALSVPAELGRGGKGVTRTE